MPKTLAELVTASKKLQADGKVKFGYVGGMYAAEEQLGRPASGPEARHE